MGVTVRPRSGLSLLELLRRSGYPVRSDCGGRGTCGKCQVTITGEEGTRSVQACEYVPTAPCTVELPEPAPWIRKRAGPSNPALALAGDAGTTTVSLAAVDARTGRRVRSRCFLNPQLASGADVMTRISRWREVRRVDLIEPFRQFMAEAGISGRRTAVIVGNTAMIHFLLGRNPSRLGSYPYRSAVRLHRPVSAQVGGLRVWIPPLLDNFVGADCTAAVVASGMHRRNGLELLVDAGTNGEVVLGNREKMLVCSTAAGPAFEGATLECGSLTVPGAIRAVGRRGRRFALDTIRNRAPRSICGSGVLSGIRAALDAGLLEPSGRVVGASRVDFAHDPPVYLSQADVREVQLAVAALATGVKLLLAAAGRQSTDIARVHLTGRFGAAIRPEDAVAIGLLPDLPGSRVRRHPNLALRGAVLMTADPARRREAAAVAEVAEEVRLSGHEGFEETFVRSMVLARWR